jgi:hypothetical protein
MTKLIPQSVVLLAYLGVVKFASQPRSISDFGLCRKAPWQMVTPPVSLAANSAIYNFQRFMIYSLNHIGEHHSSTPSTLSSMPSFNPNVIGAVEIGVLVSVLFHGIFSIQAYHYFSNFPNDAWGLKLTVSWLPRNFRDLVLWFDVDL